MEQPPEHIVFDDGYKEKSKNEIIERKRERGAYLTGDPLLSEITQSNRPLQNPPDKLTLDEFGSHRKISGKKVRKPLIHTDEASKVDTLPSIKKLRQQVHNIEANSKIMCYISITIAIVWPIVLRFMFRS